MKNELKDRLIDAMARLDEDHVFMYTEELVKAGKTPQDIQAYLNEGLKQVGTQFEKGEYFIADLMVSGMIYRSVLNLLSPGQYNPSGRSKGLGVIGVVEKDIHDIGKDIVADLLTADNFDIIDLGIDVKPETFVEAIRNHKPQIVMLSGMMQYAQESMKETVDAIKAAGLRDQVYIILGGGCIDSTILERIDADAVAIEPAHTLQYCNEFVRTRRCP